MVNINTENEYSATKEYGITSVPTLKLFRNGRVIETMHGYQSENDLTKILDLYVARDADQILAQAVQLYDLLGFYAQVDRTCDIQALTTQIELNPDDVETKQQLVSIMDIDQGYNDNYARKVMLKVFNILGNADPLASRFRSELKRYVH